MISTTNGIGHTKAPNGSANGHQRVLLPTPADWVLGPKQGEWTYETYVAIPEDGQRYEVVEGVLYLMPKPKERHQNAIGRIFRYLAGFVEDNELGATYIAPFDVELGLKNVFQPDVLVILNEHADYITTSRIIGTPDLVVEMASPSTASLDQNGKRVAYAQTGVSEYWIADPDKETVTLLVLEDGDYRCLGTFSGPEQLPSRLLPGFSVKVEKFFLPAIRQKIAVPPKKEESPNGVSEAHE